MEKCSISPVSLRASLDDRVDRYLRGQAAFSSVGDGYNCHVLATYDPYSSALLILVSTYGKVDAAVIDNYSEYHQRARSCDRSQSSNGGRNRLRNGGISRLKGDGLA